MVRKQLSIVQLYPAEMNIYGDYGNVKILAYRAKLYGYDSKIESYNSISDADKLARADILLGGGGQDSGQRKILNDLAQIKPQLVSQVRAGLPALVICGLYQLFGNMFRTKDGDNLPGLGVFDMETVGSDQRLIGNIVVNAPGVGMLIGYENHSGLTQLASPELALGEVVKGYGNNSKDGTEGARSFNAYGSYLHGPILSKNPALADKLISLASGRKFNDGQLLPVNEPARQELLKLANLSDRARKIAIARPQ